MPGGGGEGGGWSQSRGEAEGGVRAQRSKAAAPNRRSGVGSNEITRTLVKELSARNLRGPGPEPSDRQS